MASRPSRIGLGIQARVLVFALGLALPALIIVGGLSLNRIARARDAAVEQSKATLLAQAERTLQERAIDKAELYDQTINAIQLQTLSVRDVAVKAFSTAQSDLPPLRIERFWLANRGAVANPPADLRLSVNQAQVVVDALRTQVSGNQLISLGYIALENGVVAFDHPDVVSQLPDLFDARGREWYIAAIQRSGPIWTEPYVDAVTRDLAITTAVPVTISGRLVGVVGMDILLTTIQSDILRLSSDSAGYAFLMEPNGQIIVRPDLEVGDTHWDETFTTDNLLDNADPGFDTLAQLLQNHESGVLRLQLDGGDRYLAFAPMATTGWVVGLVLPIDEVVSPAVAAGAIIQTQQNRLRSNLLTTLLITSLIIVGLAAILGNTIIRPLRTLDEGAQRVAEGELSHQLPVRGNDEIARLSASFNSMTEALREKVGELELNAQQMGAINEVSNELKRLRSLSSVLQQIPVLLCERLGFDRAVLYLVEDHQLKVVAVSFGSSGDENARDFLQAVQQEPILLDGPSLEASVVTSRQAVIVENPWEHPQVLQRKQAASHSKSYVQAPIVGREQVLGIISADYYKQDRNVSVQDASLLLNFADMVGLTIENAFSFQNLEDLVEQRTAELRDALDQAQAADRLKSQFLASVSHELRTPLNAIIGFSTVLIDELTESIDEAQREDLETINKNGRYLLELINDILDMARIEAGRMSLRREPTAVRPIVDDAVDLLAAFAASKGIQLRVDVDPHLAPIDADPTRLRQIIINLLNNALKFTERGQVVIRAHRRIIDHPSAVGSHTLASGDWIIINVQDTGIGMDADAIANLFQEFRQVHAGARGIFGSGLGLSITRRLIDLHAGELWVDSKPGVGSTFSFAIATAPIVEPETAPA